MRILVTNDDGIMAPGIQALAKAMKKIGEVYMVAPLEEKSAIGHGITIRDPIKVKRMEFEGIIESWAVNGTPADCVKLAIQELITKKFDMVISGINHGPNLGTDVLYSGTVSAAIEGIILGVPAIAVSLTSYSYQDFQASAHIAQVLTGYLQNNIANMPPDTLINVNIPPVEQKEIKGYKVTRLGSRDYDNVFDKRQDPRGNIYYWLSGSAVPSVEDDPGIDVVAIEQNFVSVTPIHFDLTNHRIMKEIKNWGIEDISI